MIKTILSIAVSAMLFFAKPNIAHKANTGKLLSQVTYSLLDRYPNTYVNDVFADNILLTLAYMSGQIKSGQNISWSTVESPSTHELVLKPGQTFAFHDQTMDKYKGKVVATTNAHFDSYEGYKSDGWLVGDGVCHLASFMYVASKQAGLMSEAPTPHNFAKIEDVPKEYGVSIYTSSPEQNLYITNNQSKPIAFVFTHNKESLNIKVEELN